MSELTEYVKNLLQLGSALWPIMLLLLITLLGIAAYKLTHRKQIASNGKVIITRTLNLSLTRFIPSISFTFKGRNPSTSKGHKPFTPIQRRCLRLIYSAHEAFFGLIVFGFGLGLLSKVLVDVTTGTQQILDPTMVTCILFGIIAMPIGVLLVYFRDADNPFDEKQTRS